MGSMQEHVEDIHRQLTFPFVPLIHKIGERVE
jgi:hypothetical protein